MNFKALKMDGLGNDFLIIDNRNQKVSLNQEQILKLSDKSGITYQIEVESAGGSDGNQLQKSSYPFDWCFIGAPEDHVHSPDEKVHKKDIEAMVQLYTYLMKHL